MTDVSVIIPTFNSSQFLDACLESVYGQDGVDTEIVVVDDGSTDDTSTLLACHRSKIKYIYQDNRGPHVARNTGMRECAGRYIQFLDADDLLGENCLKAKLAHLENSDEKRIAVGRSMLFSNLKKNRKPKVTGEWHVYCQNLDIHLCRLNIAPPHAFFFPSQLTDDVGFFNEEIRGCEDYDFWLKAQGAGYIPQYCASSEVFYRKHSASRGSVKRLQGEYEYDVLVHEKKHRRKYGRGVSRVLETIPGTIAFCDGLLATAAAIDREVNEKGFLRMTELATEYLTQFLNSAPPKYENLTRESKLYLTRILLRSNFVYGTYDAELMSLFEHLRKKYNLLRTLIDNVLTSIPFANYDCQSLLSATCKLSFSKALNAYPELARRQP